MFSMPKLSADVDGRSGQMHLHKVDNNLADLLCGDLRSSPKGVEHLSLVVCGQMGSGKSTIAGQLLVKMGTVSVSDSENIQHQLKEMGGGLDFEPALFMDTTVDERLEGHSMACTTNEFYTDRYHYSVTDVPGATCHLKSAIQGMTQADVAILVVPADETFEASIDVGNRKLSVPEGGSRLHARILKHLDVEQLIIVVNKADMAASPVDASSCADENYLSQSRFDYMRTKIRRMLLDVGYSKQTILSSVPIIPVCGATGENIASPADKLSWWSDVWIGKGDLSACSVLTLVDALDRCVTVPRRHPELPLRIPISQCFALPNVGIIVTGRVEQGMLKIGDEVSFLPSPIKRGKIVGGKVLSIEMHHEDLDVACPGDIVGIRVADLNPVNKPKRGDCLVLSTDASLKVCRSFKARVSVMPDVPGDLHRGYTPVAFSRTGRACCRMTQILWKVGPSTGHVRVQDPEHFEKNDVGEAEFEPLVEFCCDPQTPVLFFDSNHCVFAGKVSVAYSSDVDVEVKKKTQGWQKILEQVTGFFKEELAPVAARAV